VPDAVTEKHSSHEDREQSNRRLARIAGVSKIEDHGHDHSGSPETQGRAVWSFEKTAIQRCQPASEGVKKKSATQRLFREGYETKCQEPQRSITPNLRPEDQSALDYQQAALPKRENEKGNQKQPRDQAGQKQLHPVRPAKTVRPSTAFNL